MSPIRKRLIIAMAAALIVAAIPVAAIAAGGTFTDDDTSIFEGDIEWLAAAGVTAGCNPPTNDHFCPTDSVTRGQMAAFMRRFAQYIDAEDGTPAEADHAAAADTATSADNATTADFATDAGKVDGKNAVQFQPTTNDFDTDDLTVNSNGNFTVVSATVATTESTGFLCRLGTSPTADIRVHVSGAVSGLTAGEIATFLLYDSSGQIVGTTRYVSDNYGSFALDWLYESPGGTESFSLVVNEAGGDTFGVVDAVILAEVISDTRCKGTPIIVLPGEPAGDPQPASE